MSGGEHLLGLDTGMSKTAVALGDRDGRVLAEVRGPGTTFLGEPTEEQLAVLDDLVSQACATAGVGRGDLAYVAAGISGVDFEAQREAQQAALCRGLGLDPGRTSLVNDAVVALWGATSAPRSMIVQQGSAYTSAYRSAPGLETVFDPFDYARLFDLRRESLARVVRMLDGRAERTGFADRFLEHLGVPDLDGLHESLGARPGAGWGKLATIAGVVSAAWLDGDAAAAEMIESLAADLAITVGAMAERLGEGPFEAAFGGGVLTRLAPAFLDLVADRVRTRRSGARVVGVALSPEHGALVMAGHHAGLRAATLFEALVERGAGAAPRGLVPGYDGAER